MKSCVWIGLVGVVPRRSNSMLEGANGAYVNVVAYVSNADEFCKEVVSALSEAGFDVVDIDDVEAFDDRRSHYEVDDAINVIADECQKDHTTSLGVFYPFSCEIGRRAGPEGK